MPSPYIEMVQARMKARENAALHLNDQQVYIPPTIRPDGLSRAYNAIPYIIGAILLALICVDMAWN